MNDTVPLSPQEIIEKKRKFLIPCAYHFYKDPPHIVRGEGAYLIDSTGKRYLDLYCGVSVNALGHCHPEVTEAICAQVKTLQHTTTIYLTEGLVNLAEAMAEVFPDGISKTFFCASGSEANEGAALLATLFTGRNEFLVLQNGLHGRTKLGMSLTGLAFWRTDPNPVGGIIAVPPPHCSQCPFGQKFGSCRYECVDAVEKAIQTSTSGKPAAMFLEPVQGNGGIHVPPPEYLPRLKKLLERYGTLLIADEVQTGFGRTGKMFAMEHWNVAPDIITGGKALGGGTPIGYFATTEKIAASFTRPSGSTFGGNPVTAAAGLAFLRILKREKLVEHAARVGTILKERFTAIAKRSDLIEEVRGLGVMLGIQMKNRGEKTSAQLTDQILEEMKNNGFLLGKTGAGRNVLTFMPPFIATENQLLNAADVFEKALSQV